MEYYVSVSLIAVASALSCFAALPMLKIVQLAGYRARGVVAWWKDSACDVLVRYGSLMLFSFIAMIVFVGCFGSFEYVGYCAPALYIVLAVVFIVSAGKSGSNGVKFTGRAVRIMLINSVLTFGLGALVAWASYYSVYCQTLTAAVAMFVPLTVLAANAIAYPFEQLNNKKYIKRAKSRLASAQPIVIGITGSFGKTTAKNILAAMLKEKYTVLATPGSFNTPMGICKTVNNMFADEQVFIAEMGARYKGDIKQLCDIVSPKYGIITAVGDMHIRTLGSRAGVADTKFELGTALPQNGVLVLNGYNADCAALSDRECVCEKRVTGNDNCVFYRDLEFGKDGTRFELVINGVGHTVTSRLLGAHIAELACVCAAIATELEVPAESILKALADMQPVEHRLQLIPTENARIVIDDAYNSNPVGAKNALDVLSCFNGKKLIITPGFVELGGIEKQCNTELGGRIAGVCDYAFLVGPRAADIKKGAIKAGMSDGCIYEFKSRDDAVAALKDIPQCDVVLFENDIG